MDYVRPLAQRHSDQAQERPQFAERIETAARVLKWNEYQASCADDVSMFAHAGDDDHCIAGPFGSDGHRETVRYEEPVLGYDEEQLALLHRHDLRNPPWAYRSSQADERLAQRGCPARDATLLFCCPRPKHQHVPQLILPVAF